MNNSSDLFPEQPDSARVWVLASDRKLASGDRERMDALMSDFFSSWTSHENRVVAEADWIDDRFLVVAAHIPNGDVSGCGIDKLMHAASRGADIAGCGWHDPLTVFYRTADGEVRAATRAEFLSLAKNRVVDASTVVLDTAVHRLADLRERGLAKPAGECWHGSAFKLEPTSAIRV